MSSNYTILIIGAAGQLGSDLKRVLEKNNKILAPSHAELDLTNFSQLEKYIITQKPDFIINTAAFHNVDECEQNPEKAFLINTYAVKKLAEIVKMIDGTLIHISTDYVFGVDTQRELPYGEDDNPGPVNFYGVSKLSGEYCIQYILEKFYIIRVSALFGVVGCRQKGGTNFVETMIKLAKDNKEIKIKYDEYVSPTYTLEAAYNIEKLITTKKYGIYHMTNEGYCSWYDFAKKIFELLNLEPKCIAVSHKDMPTIVRRPNYSVLENKKLKEINLNLMSHWEVSLEKYLREKGYLK